MYLIRRCACGSVIRLRDSICKNCRIKYGNDRSEWPEWMKFLVSQEQSEINKKRNRSFALFIDDEYFNPESKHAPKINMELDVEEMIWNRQL